MPCMRKIFIRGCYFWAALPWLFFLSVTAVAQTTQTTASSQAGKQDGPAGTGIFEIKEIDVGDQAWGRNLLRLKVRNLTGLPQPFWVHIGGRYQDTGRPLGFGMGMEDPVLIAPREERLIEHPYWIPPHLGRLAFTVKCVRPGGENPPPQEQEPFFKISFTTTYKSPNDRCNELTPLAQFLAPQFSNQIWYEQYRAGAKIPPFAVTASSHFVFYVLPGSPAQRDLAAIQARREKILGEICAFLGVALAEPVSFFLFPDAPSKGWCMMHQGDGLAYDTTIAELYNEKTRLDPAHELTHIVAGQLGHPPALLVEGLAVAMQAGRKWKDRPVDETAAALLRAGRLTPLPDLLRRTEIGAQPDDGDVAYPAAASFVAFLIDRHGRERFLQLYRRLENGGSDNAARFREVLGVDLVAAGQAWRTALGGDVKK